MRPTVLVVTTVHWPDDTRIRERLIRSLSAGFSIDYASRSPGPSDRAGLRWIELAGGRLRRNLGAIRVALRSDWDVMVVHDPELVVCALLARMVRKRPVVFDVHEDVPASAYTRGWVPGWMRRPLSAVLVRILRVVERFLEVTLAEPGYQRLFRRHHPVFVNYPDTTRYPVPGGDSDGPAVYLGDVTLERGADVAVEACVRAQVPMRLIGRTTAALQALLRGSWVSAETLTIDGMLPNQEAIQSLTTCSVGLAPLRDLPNYRYSQPTKVLEYLAMGLPVVASDLPGTRQLVEGLDAVSLVSPGDPVALAAAVRESRTSEMMERARSQAPTIRERFRWPAGEVRAYYESLL